MQHRYSYGKDFRVISCVVFLPKLVDILIMIELETKTTNIWHEEARTFMICRLHWWHNWGKPCSLWFESWGVGRNIWRFKLKNRI